MGDFQVTGWVNYQKLRLTFRGRGWFSEKIPAASNQGI